MGKSQERPFVEFGRRLKALRLRGNITTQRELVDRLADVGIYYEYTVVSHWERGRRCPSWNVLVAILRVLAETEGIQSVAEANELLRLAGMRDLNEEEITWIFGQAPPSTVPAAPSSASERAVAATWSYWAGSGAASVEVAEGGCRILLGTLDKRVICLDPVGTARWEAPVGNQAWRVALSSDGQTAVVGTGSTRPWDMGGRGVYAFDGNGRLRWRRDLGASVWGLALAADGRTLAAGTDGREAVLLDEAGNLLWRRRMAGVGWGAWVWAAALSSDGQTVVIGSANRSIQVLDRGGNLLGEYAAGADVYTVSISADGQTAAAGSGDRQLYLLDRQGGLLWREKLRDAVWTVALTSDGQRLVVGAGAKEAHVRVFDRQGRALWKRYVEGGVSCAAVSTGGEIVTAGTRAGHVHIFDGSGDPLYHFQMEKIVRDVAVSADGRLVVAVSESGQVQGVSLVQATDGRAGTKS